MTAPAELVMPKLGLTMTEGRIARWAVSAGARFAKGACIVEVETDKIVNEVEAPADGVLVEVLVPAGDTVEVATPIARWRLEGGEAGPPVATTSRHRIIATPYARRLARARGIDLGTLTGSGPRGRIKAADVPSNRTQEARDDATATAIVEQLAAPTEALVPMARLHTTSPASIILMDFDTGRLLEAERALSRGKRGLEIHHLVAIAALRALAARRGETAMIGIGLGLPVLRAAKLPPNLSGTAIANVLLSTDAPVPDGDLVVIAGQGARIFAPNPPLGWRATMNLGGTRDVARRTGDGGITWGHEATLALTYDAGLLRHDVAVALIEDVACALADPLHLLAS